MAVKKKNPGYEQFRADLAADTLGTAYVFYGEESYLREYYLSEMRKRLVGGFESFNYHRVEGKALTVQALAEMAEAMPMLSPRTLIVVTDWDLFKLGEEQRNRLIALLSDLPEYCCLVFVYDTLAYQPSAVQRKLVKALKDHVETVEFRPAGESDLIPWIARRFKALGKSIDRRTAEYLIFLCGGLMTNLVQEIEKIGAYAKGAAITQEDIDAVAEPVLSAEVFKLTDMILRGDYDKAAEILGDLLKMKTDAFQILGALGSQLRRIYTARLAIDGGKDRYWLMELWGMKSDYPARLLMDAARRTDGLWCAGAVQRCQVLDRRLKSQRGADPAAELKLLLAQLGASRQ